MKRPAVLWLFCVNAGETGSCNSRIDHEKRLMARANSKETRLGSSIG